MSGLSEQRGEGSGRASVSKGSSSTQMNGRSSTAAKPAGSNVVISGASDIAGQTSSMRNESDGRPSEEWLRSIDSVYYLFEDDRIRSAWPDLSRKVESGVRLCEEVLNQYGLEQTALSFNGGKDCTVVVHMLAAAIRRRAGLSSPRSDRLTPADSAPQQVPSISSVYITCPSPFPSLEKFVEASMSSDRYNLALVKVPGGMKEGLTQYLAGEGKEVLDNISTPSQRKPPRNVKAIFVGTRRTDPMGGTLEPRAHTDSGWPAVERIHPILDWDYKDVWAFLRCPILGSRPAGHDVAEYMSVDEVDKLPGLSGAEQARTGSAGGGQRGVPYCVLYEQGYTSLGSTFNTLPNPELRIAPSIPKSMGGRREGEGGDGLDTVGDGTAVGRWKPAHALQDGSLERAGRVKGSTPIALP